GAREGMIVEKSARRIAVLLPFFSRSKNSVSIRTPDRASRHGTEERLANRANFSSAPMIDGTNFVCDYTALAVNGCECQKILHLALEIENRQNQIDMRATPKGSRGPAPALTGPERRDLSKSVCP